MKNTYYGSKRGSGSFQQIMNEIPPVDKVIIGFLGNCPLFEYFSGKVDTIAYERSAKTIQDYWSNHPGNIINADVLPQLPQLLSTASAGAATFVYFDPPYLLDTRKSNKKVYEFEMSKDDHIYLLDQVTQPEVSALDKVAISCYDNKLYAEKLKGWRKKQWQVSTRNGTAIETLYMNYDTPKRLFTYDFLGNDRTDRQRIKRKISRIQNRLQELEPREAQAIFINLEKMMK